ncbi:la-related protein 6 isoform X2 [Heliangelus exortis]|uniref:la-related protein 6 isoform X2 n=1 Tax=Heliangelus exortis TaxID=472823 RepID=UPI003A94E219
MPCRARPGKRSCQRRLSGRGGGEEGGGCRSPGHRCCGGSGLSPAGGTASSARHHGPAAATHIDGPRGGGGGCRGRRPAAGGGERPRADPSGCPGGRGRRGGRRGKEPGGAGRQQLQRGGLGAVRTLQVKHLTRDWRTTAYALKYSDTLELNDDNRKVRRNTPVPVFPSENLPTRMLLVYDIHMIPELQPLDKQENGCTQERIMEHLLKTFVTFGVISSVRILKPGRDLPADIKRVSNRYPQLGTQECAIIEFEEVDAAVRAHDFMCAETKETAIKVVLIGMKPPKKKVPKDKNRDEDASKSLKKARSLNKRVEELQFVGDESSANSSSDPESNPTSPLSGRKNTATNTRSNLSPVIHPANHLSPNVSPRSSPWNSPSSLRKVTKKSPLAEDSKLNPSTSPEGRKCTDYSSDSSITPSGSPWVQRRKAQTATQEKSPATSPMLARKIQNADGLPVGVLRLPKGPDGTKGFHNGCEPRRAAKNK